MQSVFLEGNLYEMTEPFFLKNKKKMSFSNVNPVC